ncbi:uncharacterized protein LOC141613768 [Silene latifolia]|uniref:uncharacterized protein LOC141613768 n=1 Tax=Silene latifolia TaxID=37657 RepID=UPI003D780E8A
MSGNISSRQSSGMCVRCCIMVVVFGLILYILGPTLHWKVNKGTMLGHDSAISCSPCICDCPPPLSILNIGPGLANLSTEDCGKSDPELQNEMEKQYAELLLEELKLQEMVSEEQLRHMNATYREARRVASQYQREAEKCNVATETCEESRERAEALLRTEIKLSFLWEERALKLGWEVE